MDERCIGCKNYYEDNFCSYTASWCRYYGCIDCNPDNILRTFEGSCPKYNVSKEEEKEQNLILNGEFKNLEPFVDF